MKTEQAELLQSQTSAGEEKEYNNSSFEDSMIIERNNYKGLQIIALKQETKQKHFAALGSTRLTDYFQSEQQLIEYLEQKPYELITTLAGTIAEIMYEELKNK